jgi:Tol biopolymer transport system component
VIPQRVLPLGLVFILQGFLVACGGGGGGGDDTWTPPGSLPVAECFADYNSEQKSWDAYRSSRGRAVYTSDNRDSLYSLNLASGDISLVSDSLTGWPLFSDTGRFIVYPVRGIAAPIYDQVEGRDLPDAALSNFSSLQLSWAPGDIGLLSAYFLGQQLFSGPLFRNADAMYVAESLGNAWSADGEMLVVVQSEQFVFYEMSPIRLIRTIPREPGSPLPRGLSFDPSGNYLTYTTSHVPEGADAYQRNVYLLNLHTSESSIIFTTTDTGGLSSDYEWAPSGKYIALVSYDDQNIFGLSLYSVDSQSTQRIQGADRQVWGYQWAPDADRLLFLRDDGDTQTAHLMGDPETADSIQVSESSGKFVESIAWSPDSRYFAYVSSGVSNESKLYAGDAEAGCFSAVELLESSSGVPYGTVQWSPSGQYLLYSAQVEGSQEELVIRPDGSGRVSLTQLILPSGSTGSVRSVGWSRVSDTVYLRKYSGSGGIESINFVEIDSLSLMSVEANGAYGFAETVTLTE